MTVLNIGSKPSVTITAPSKPTSVKVVPASNGTSVKLILGGLQPQPLVVKVVPALNTLSVKLLTGIRGPAGAAGPQGVQGPPGPTGEQGPKGDPGQQDVVVVVTRSLILGSDWTDTGITSSNLTTGTYIIQMYANDESYGGAHNDVYYSGVMSWYSQDTNGNAEDEIQLHRAGRCSTGDMFLRTFSSSLDNITTLKLQMYCTSGTNYPSNYVFTFRKLI